MGFSAVHWVFISPPWRKERCPCGVQRFFATCTLCLTARLTALRTPRHWACANRNYYTCFWTKSVSNPNIEVRLAAPVLASLSEVMSRIPSYRIRPSQYQQMTVSQTLILRCTTLRWIALVPQPRTAPKSTSSM